MNQLLGGLGPGSANPTIVIVHGVPGAAQKRTEILSAALGGSLGAELACHVVDGLSEMKTVFPLGLGFDPGSVHLYTAPTSLARSVNDGLLVECIRQVHDQLVADSTAPPAYLVVSLFDQAAAASPRLAGIDCAPSHVVHLHVKRVDGIKRLEVSTIAVGESLTTVDVAVSKWSDLPALLISALERGVVKNPVAVQQATLIGPVAPPARPRRGLLRWGLAIVLGALLTVTAILAWSDMGSSDRASALGFRGTVIGGAPVRWDPCLGPIPVKVNLGNLLPVYARRAKAAVEGAVVELRLATGLDFRYSGATDKLVTSKTAEESSKHLGGIVVSFQPLGTGILSRRDGDVVTRISVDTSNRTEQWVRIAAADVQIRPKARNYTASALQGLGRAVGIASVDASQGPTAIGGQAVGSQYTENDRAALEAFGQSAGCFPGRSPSPT